MLLTIKQNQILQLIQKNNKIIITPRGVFLQQKKNQIFTNKAISQHLQNLTKIGLLIRVKQGNYMLADSIKTPQKAPKTTQKSKAAKIQKAPVVLATPEVKEILVAPKKETLPSFLSHEDIEKLIEWKKDSITKTTERIENLQLKINKLKSQQTTLFSIKKQFC